ncbi:putative K domain, type 1 protein [Helianthus anomalus]
MVIPGHAVGKVMGKGGANVDKIHKGYRFRDINFLETSHLMFSCSPDIRSSVEIFESKSSRGDRVAVIFGTPEQKRSAENLIQAFLTIALVRI